MRVIFIGTVEFSLHTLQKLIDLNDILNYLKVSKEEFDEIINNARPNHLWNKVNNEWKLKQPIWKEREKNA